MNQVYLSTETTFSQLTHLLSELNDEDYSKPLAMLSNNTVGKHLRHILEMYHCLINNYDSGIVDYDKRERNSTLETNKVIAINSLQEILRSVINKEDKSLVLNTYYDYNAITPEKIQTNFHRELAFALEHCIHHMAIIRIAVESNFSYINVEPSFGVATSTMRYIEQCAQ
jgi:uncharacterized damage-inducible protein DinB